MGRVIQGGRRALQDPAADIHEQEIGHKVFGRPADYDTTSDNIVRVHASLLRKRLEQYFSSEGSRERLILEIPRGNYAPLFRERPEAEFSPPLRSPAAALAISRDWRVRTLATAALLFAASTAFLLVRLVRPKDATASIGAAPAIRSFWLRVFPGDRPTDIVLDDAAVGLFQELTGRSLALSDYFDRGYQRNLAEQGAETGLDPKLASSIVLRRHSSFANANFLWKLLQTPGFDHQHAMLRFAREYSFRELKADNAVLLGNSHSNPWIEPFLPKLGIRWI